MLWSIIGDIRTGKSTLLTAFGINSNRKVYSNFKIKIPNYKKLLPQDLFNLPNNIDVLIDEAYILLESRKSSRDLNILASNILFQSGKRNIDIYIAIQLFSALDIRFRNMSNVLIETSKNDILEFFQYDIFIKHYGQFKYIKTIILPYSEANDIFPYFDTYEIVKSVLQEKYELESLFQDSEKLYRYVQDLSVEIKKELKNLKPTYNNISITMLKLGYSDLFIKKLKTFIYSYLNTK